MRISVTLFHRNITMYFIELPETNRIIQRNVDAFSLSHLMCILHTLQSAFWRTRILLTLRMQLWCFVVIQHDDESVAYSLQVLTLYDMQLERQTFCYNLKMMRNLFKSASTRTTLNEKLKHSNWTRSHRFMPGTFEWFDISNVIFLQSFFFICYHYLNYASKLHN